MTDVPRPRGDKIIVDFLRPKLEQVAQELHDALMDYAESGAFTPHMDVAFHAFFSEDTLDILDPEEEAAFISFIEWFVYDYRLTPRGGRLIESFFKENEKTFGPLEREIPVYLRPVQKHRGIHRGQRHAFGVACGAGRRGLAGARARVRVDRNVRAL